MDFPISALSSALAGIERCMRRMDRAADVAAGTTTGSAAAAPHGTAGEVDLVARAEVTGLVGAMVDVLIAQRAFSEQVRVMESAQAAVREAEKPPGS